MKLVLRIACALTVCAFVAPPLSAQWPDFRVPGAPRLPNGQVDLSAPAPKTADGKPDLSGIWQNGQAARGGGANANAAPRGGPGAAAQPPAGQRGAGPPPAGRGGQRGGPAAPAAAADTGIPVATFANVGAGFKDGLPMQPWAADLVKKRMADNSKDNPDAHCLPMGFMQFHTHPEPRKIIQTPGVTLIIYEANSGLRQIFTDGRALPKDPLPWWYGYSVGHWEGDTLVVESTGFLDTDPQWLDVRGSPLTEAAKVTERFRRTNYGTLEIEVTVDDSKAYTKPWTVRLTQRLLPDTELIEFICEDRDATHYVGAAK